MKKWTLLFFLLPFVVYAQQIDLDKVPYKSALVHLLHANNHIQPIDTTDTGYSTLQYHSFSSKGQFINVRHQQYLTDYLLFNIHFDKFSQEGIYNRENLKLHNVQTNLLFTNKNKRYQAHLYLGYHKITMDENGGIFNYAFNFDEPLLNQINLLSAQNEAKNRNHAFSQKFNLTDNWSISNQISIISNRRTYSDESPNSIFYSDIYIDSTQTYDSLSTLDISNRFGISYKNFTVSQLLHSRQAFINTIDSTDNDLGLAFDYTNDRYGIYFNSEFYQSSHLSLLLSKSFKIKSSSHQLALSYDKTRTPIFINSYYSNHYLFDTEFSNTKSLAASYLFKLKDWSFSTKLNEYTDYIFLDQSAKYQQYRSSILHWHNKLSLGWNWKKFHTLHSIDYHYTDNTRILRFPNFNYTTTWWLESDLFGDNLNTQVGAQLNYFTAYYAQAYNPALALYQLQDTQFVGEVPLLSAFINLKVHNMNINIKYRNVLSLLKENTDMHYFIPNYPNYPPTIQFSVVWKLSNFSNKAL